MQHPNADPAAGFRDFDSHEFRLRVSNPIEPNMELHSNYWRIHVQYDQYLIVYTTSLILMQHPNPDPAASFRDFNLHEFRGRVSTPIEANMELHSN